MITTVRTIGSVLLLSALPLRAAAEDFPDAIHAYLQQCVEAEKVNLGIVVGIVDEHGSSVVSCGKLGDGTDQAVNGDTLFEIGSVTKTFTGLLLQDMIQRVEMKLDDPVAKYLPNTVKMPTRNGKEITLLHLATHTSGLPPEPDNLDPKRAEYPCEDYTVEKLYAFLSGYQLTRDPGAEFEYSSAGIAVLAQAIALKARADYESLVVDRICRPLRMDSTRITLTPELRARFAVGHSPPGFVTPSYDFGALAPAGALRSTASDMLKYVSANLGLSPSGVAPLMERTHEVRFRHVMPDTDIGLVWVTSRDPQGTEIVWHNGALYGSVAFAGFDKARCRGVVVMSNSRGFLDATGLGKFLLESEWQSDCRPTEAGIRGQTYARYVGQYQRSPDLAPGLLAMRRFLRSVPGLAIYIPAGFCLAVLVILLWRAGRFRKRLIILGCAVLVSGLLAVILALVSGRAVGEPSQPGIGIRSERDRLFAQATGSRSWPVEVLLPPISAELLPESETRLFERLSGTPMVFSLDARGKVTGLTLHHRGRAFSYERISEEPPRAPDPPRRPVVIKLDTKLLDAYVGHYEIAPDATSPTGARLAIWREGDHLVGQIWGKNTTRGAIDIYAESETSFFLKTDGSQLSFIKNGKGEVTDVIHHFPGHPDHKGKRLKD